MNWIIKNTEKLNSHTDLSNLLNLSWINVSDFNWLMSDLDIVNFSKKELPIDLRENFSILNSEDFKKIIEMDVQVIWGLITAVKKTENPQFDKQNFPFVEGNDEVWKNDNFQVENSVFEIIAWDSSYTIIKFRDLELSKKFKNYFVEAIELEKFKS